MTKSQSKLSVVLNGIKDFSTWGEPFEDADSLQNQSH